MGLDQKFIIRVNNQEHELEMRKLYPVQNILVSVPGFVNGEIHLSEHAIYNLLSKLTKWLQFVRLQSRDLAIKYPNGVSMMTLAEEDQQVFRDYCDIEYVEEVIAFFNKHNPTKDKDFLVVYLFDS